MEYYVYAHRRNDNGEIFYIGKGCGKRAWKKSTRSDWWKRIEAKHGRTVEFIARGLDEEQAFLLEVEVIASFPDGALCNLNGGGLGGISPSEATRLKMSMARKGRIVSDETRELMRIAGLGRKQSEESKEKIRAARARQVMKPVSAETRLKMSETAKLRVRTPEHCAAISRAKKGVPRGPMSEETKDLLAIRQTGKRHTLEAIAKMSASSKGKTHSPETIAKLTESNRRLNAARRKPITCSNGMTFDFSGTAEAWVRDNGYPKASKANIVSCCTGKLKTAYGFTWKFAESPAT